MAMEAVAREARVGRQSVYRRWPRKPLLVFDAMFGGAEAAEAILPATGTLAGDLAALLANVRATYATPEDRDLARGLLADALADPEILDELRRRFVWPRLEVVERIVDRARDAGEIRSDIASATLAETVLGATIGHYLIIGRPGERFISELAAVLTSGLQAWDSRK